MSTITATRHSTSWARRPRPAPGVRLLTDGGRSRLVDPDERTLHVVNATALALWELCDGETTVEEMVTAAGALFDADIGDVRRDIESTLDVFTSAHLLVWDDA